MGSECEAMHPDTDRLEKELGGAVDELIDWERNRDKMRFFLVACLQASVSVETMSAYLGLDAKTVRSELLLGIEAWNAAQRRTSQTVSQPHLRIAAARE
jgi:hypothetical protein